MKTTDFLLGLACVIGVCILLYLTLAPDPSPSHQGWDVEAPAPKEPPEFKFFLVYTGAGYAEGTPNAAGYKLYSIQAHSDAYKYNSRQWVTLIYRLESK